jgi:hypothetical protein
MLAQWAIALPEEPQVDAGLVEDVATARKLSARISGLEFHQADCTLMPLVTFTYDCAKA